MFERFGKFMGNEDAKAGEDMITKIIGVVFALYVVSYAAVGALLALINASGFSATGPIAPILQTLVPVLVTIGFGWMFYKHMAIK